MAAARRSGKADKAPPPLVAKAAARGAPTKYSPDVDERAYELALLGLTDVEIAHQLAICERTLNNWKAAHPAFGARLNDGKLIADAKVARGLYKRAAGTDDQPGETAAARYWLNNRQRWRWSDRIEHTGAAGGPIDVQQRHTIDPRTLSPEGRDALRQILSEAIAQQGDDGAAPGG